SRASAPAGCHGAFSGRSRRNARLGEICWPERARHWYAHLRRISSAERCDEKVRIHRRERYPNGPGTGLKIGTRASKPAAKRRKSKAHGTSRGCKIQSIQPRRGERTTVTQTF